MAEMLHNISCRIRAFNDRVRGYRTYFIAFVLGLIGVIEQTPWSDLIPAPYKQWALVAVPILFFILRRVTTTPPGPLPIPHPGDTP